MQAVTTATVQFAVNYVPQCFNASDPYSVLSRFIIIKSMPLPHLFITRLVSQSVVMSCYDTFCSCPDLALSFLQCHFSVTDSNR